MNLPGPRGDFHLRGLPLGQDKKERAGNQNTAAQPLKDCQAFTEQKGRNHQYAERPQQQKHRGDAGSNSADGGVIQDMAEGNSA